MLAYLIRRMIYMLPVLLGVNFITFILFFMVNTPDDLARAQLGNKRVEQVSINQWKQAHGYDKPLFYNPKEQSIKAVTETLFFEKSLNLFTFKFGVSDSGRDISYDVKQRMWPSLAIAIPVLIIGLLVNISFALLIVFFRGTYVDTGGLVISVILMSISGLFYIIAGQYFIGKLWQWVPISGYENGFNALRFVLLPVFVSAIAGMGAGIRWYRTLFMEEINKDYVRTARAKGLAEFIIMFKHVLKNTLIPIATGIVAIIPTLFLGSLLMESFFAIPGLGSYMIDAIRQQDFAIVRVMVFLGTIFYILGLMMTDIVYTLVDPRVRLN